MKPRGRALSQRVHDGDEAPPLPPLKDSLASLWSSFPPSYTGVFLIPLPPPLAAPEGDGRSGIWFHSHSSSHVTLHPFRSHSGHLSQACGQLSAYLRVRVLGDPRPPGQRLGQQSPLGRQARGVTALRVVLLWESGGLLGEVLGDPNQAPPTVGTAFWVGAGMRRVQGLSEADPGAPAFVSSPTHHPLAVGKRERPCFPRPIADHQSRADGGQ